MEVKDFLKKPYTNKERLDFIVKNNHNLGFEIKETESRLEAWGKSPEEEEKFEKEQVKTKRISELKNYLSNSDWYVSRYVENGTEIPAEVKKTRQEAREEISKLREEV